MRIQTLQSQHYLLAIVALGLLVAPQVQAMETSCAGSKQKVNCGENPSDGDLCEVLKTTTEGEPLTFTGTVNASGGRASCVWGRRDATGNIVVQPSRVIEGSIADGGRFSMEVGAGAFGASSLDDVHLAFQAAPRWRLWGSNSAQVSLRTPMTFRSGDALGPWDDEINFPRLGDPASISAKQLRIGSSFVFTPGLERSFELGRSSALSLFGGLGFRYDKGETTTIADFGQARTRDSTSPAISLGVALEQRLSSRASLRWSLNGITAFRDEVGVELEAPIFFPDGSSFTREVSLDGGSETSLMMGLAIAWRPGGLQSPLPSAPPAAARVPIFCVPRKSGGLSQCSEPGYGCLVMFPASQWPAVRESFGAAPVLDGEAMVLLGERPKLLYELRAATEVERIPIEHDLPIDPSIATALGLPRATILEGEYVVDPAIGRFGGVVFDLEVGSSPNRSELLPRLQPAEIGELHNAVLAAVRDRFSPEVSSAEPEQRLDEIAAFVSLELARLRGLTPQQERQVRSLTRARAHILLGAYGNPEWSLRRVTVKVDQLREEDLIADSDAELLIDLVATMTRRHREASCQTLPPRESEVAALRQDVANLSARLGPRDEFSARALSIADSSIDFWEGNSPDPDFQPIAPWVAGDAVGCVVGAAKSALIQQGVHGEVDGEVVAWSCVGGAVLGSTGGVIKVAQWVTSWF